jgi:CheY-like chemotaxis protein
MSSQIESYQTIPVLLVDPNPQDRKQVHDQLVYGPLIGQFRVYEAASAAEAMICLFTQSAMFCDALARPGIIVTEVALPEHQDAGWRLLQHIRSDPLTSHLSTVCLTSRSDITAKLRGIQEADDYVVKVTDPQEFPVRLLLLIQSQQRSSKLRISKITYREPRIVACN